jgi:hypothetical protein
VWLAPEKNRRVQYVGKRESMKDGKGVIANDIKEFKCIKSREEYVTAFLERMQRFWTSLASVRRFGWKV